MEPIGMRAWGDTVWLLACANVSMLLLGRLPARRAELAMRAALGGQRFLGYGTACVSDSIAEVRMSLIGVGVGLAAALLLSRFLRSWLFEVQATDTTSCGYAIALLLASAVLAAWLPALRAARVDPARALRAD